MIDLAITRDKIDEVDKQIVQLFEERLQLTNDVAEYKIATGKPIYDKAREESKIEKIRSLASSEFSADGVEDLFSQIMTISRRYQYRVIDEDTEALPMEFTEVEELPMEDAKVVYQGVPGAFSEQATFQFFGEDVNAFHVESFAAVMDALESKQADYGVLPIENSSTGTVSGIYDLLAKHDVNIVGETIVEVEQALLGVPGAKIEDIKVVYSHIQGLLQSSDYLKEKDWQQVSLANTAIAARKVHEENDVTHAAIASARAAKVYDLEVLNPCLNSNKTNATRFIILSKQKIYRKGSNKISISFGLPQKSGTLYSVLANFAFNKLNMTNIESCPLPGKQWEYRFFVDFEGSFASEDVQNALKEVRAESIDMYIVGNY